jgi:hypothetical protein
VTEVSALRGVGLGFRGALAEEFLAAFPESMPALSFVEVHPENVMRRGGLQARQFAAVAERWPVLSHGLSLSLGGDRFNDDYLATLRAFLMERRVPWHTDHLCFVGDGGHATHELLPLPRSEESVAHIVARIREAQDRLEIPLAVENVTFYAETEEDRLTEGEFVTAICEEADCGLLLDVNNVYVNAMNFGEDPAARLATLPLHRTKHIHVAGHLVVPELRAPAGGPLRLDTHAEALDPRMVDLLEAALRRVGPVPVLLEHDDEFPPLAELYETVKQLANVVARATGEGARPFATASKFAGGGVARDGGPTSTGAL